MLATVQPLQVLNPNGASPLRLRDIGSILAGFGASSDVGGREREDKDGKGREREDHFGRGREVELLHRPS